MSRRDAYVHLGIEQLGKTVLWAQKGPDLFDCSGLATWLLWKVGGPDLRHLDDAQALYNATRELAPKTTDAPAPGDLAFYGDGPESIEHVAVWLAGGHVLSADGARRSISTVEAAKAANAAIRVHPTVDYRHDTPFRVVHRNVLLDQLDLVTR